MLTLRALSALAMAWHRWYLASLMDKATDLYCINEDSFLKALKVLYRRSRNMLQTRKVRAIGACLEEPRLPSPSCPAQRCKIGSRGPVGPSPSMPPDTIASQGFRTTPRLPGKVNRQPSLLLHVSSRCCEELRNLCNTCVFFNQRRFQVFLVTDPHVPLQPAARSSALGGTQ